MDHAKHFLNRLERLVGSEVDVALELYRDPGLVQAVLGALALPDGAERIAISLDDAALGPFVVVTRDGHFVTCLGRGMRSGDLPVVTRPELDACGRRVARLHEKLSLARQLEAGDRRSQQLLRRLLLSPDSISREDFLEVAAWEPLLGTACLDTYLAMGTALVEQGPLLRGLRLRKDVREAALRDYWNLLHAAGHMALLGSATAEREHYAALTGTRPGARAAHGVRPLRRCRTRAPAPPRRRSSPPRRPGAPCGRPR